MWTSRALVCLTVFNLVRFSVGDQPCGMKADIAFLLDSSRSISDPDFLILKNFTEDLLKMFDIGVNRTHVAALTFSDRVVKEFTFDEMIDPDELIKKIEGIDHVNGGATYIDEAFKAMQEDLFSNASGARPDVAHIGILLTDGEATRKEAAKEEAKLARDAGIKVMAIGIGQVNKEELKTMVTPPADEHFFYVDNFNELTSTTFLDLVGQQACVDPCKDVECQNNGTCVANKKKNTYKCACIDPWFGDNCEMKEEEEVPPTATCQGKKADVVFVIDMSNSIWDVYFKQQLQFVADVVDSFDIDSGMTEVGMLAFSNDAKVQFYLDEYQTKAEIIKAIFNVTQAGGITNTHLALKTLTDEMFTSQYGARPDVVDICILITDGRSTKPDLTIPQADEVHKKGIYMFAIGVGNDTDRAELESMASDPSDDYLFEVNGYKALPKIKDILAVKTCEVPPKVSAAPSTKPCTSPSTKPCTSSLTEPTPTTEPASPGTSETTECPEKETEEAEGAKGTKIEEGVEGANATNSTT